MASPEVIFQTFKDHDGTYIDRDRLSVERPSNSSLISAHFAVTYIDRNRLCVERPSKSCLISAHFAKSFLYMKTYNSTINEISWINIDNMRERERERERERDAVN